MTAPRRTPGVSAPRRRVRPDSEPLRTAEDVAALAPKSSMPDAHKLGAELEATANAAGRFWRALREAGLPKGFRGVMFDNWQRALWNTEDAIGINCEYDSEFDDPEPA